MIHRRHAPNGVRDASRGTPWFASMAKPDHGALRIALVYLALAAAWILASDLALTEFVPRASHLELSIAKGLLFVGTTSVVLYLLARDRLKAQLEAHRQLLDTHPMGILEVDGQGLITTACPRSQALLGAAEAQLTGVSVEEALERAGAEAVDDSPGGVPGGALQLPTGQVVLVHLDAADYQHRLVVLEDVTAQVELAREQLLSHRRYEEAQRIGNMGHWRLEMSTRSVLWSRQLYRIHGVDPEEFRPSVESWVALVYPADRVQVERFCRQPLAGAEGIGTVEHRIQRPDGSIRWMRVRAMSQAGPGGEPRVVRGTAQDITQQVVDRQRLERMQQLLSRYGEQLTDAIERERRDLAQEVHDHLGQTLSTLRILVNAPEPDARRCTELLDEAVDELRRIVHGMRPPLLDQLGLPDALRHMLDMTQAGTPAVHAEISEDLHMDPDRAIHVLRIAQEAVTNARRHADATEIRLRLREDDGRVHLTVEDDGRGLPMEPTGEDGFGLVGMEQRTRLLNGELEVESRPGGGLRVELIAPMEAA